MKSKQKGGSYQIQRDDTNPAIRDGELKVNVSSINEFTYKMAKVNGITTFVKLQNIINESNIYIHNNVDLSRYVPNKIFITSLRGTGAIFKINEKQQVEKLKDNNAHASDNDIEVRVNSVGSFLENLGQNINFANLTKVINLKKEWIKLYGRISLEKYIGTRVHIMDPANNRIVYYISGEEHYQSLPVRNAAAAFGGKSRKSHKSHKSHKSRKSRKSRKH